MIFRCQPGDRDRIYLVINEAATAYEGKIPADCYRRPYMPMDELLKRYWGIPRRQIETSVVLGMEVG